MKERAGIELRCFCSRRPLLAVCGRDSDTGEPFVHIKIYKQGRIFGEVIAIGSGVGQKVHIRCRNCERWHCVHIQRADPTLVQEDPPASLPIGV